MRRRPSCRRSSPRPPGGPSELPAGPAASASSTGSTCCDPGPTATGCGWRCAPSAAPTSWTRKGAATPGLARTLRDVSLATNSYRLDKPDTAPRLEVLCPRGKYPIGGGISQSPAVGADGEGIYPHSFERLGAQLGYHVSVVVLDPSPAKTTTREVTVQAVCGRGVIVARPSPHKTVWVRSGQTKTVTARCPNGQFLVSGGFQRTNFRSDGGDYITESRMASNKSWTVT